MAFRDQVGSRKPPHIAVVGSSIMDLIAYTEHFPLPGETVKGKNFETGFGGKGANQAVAARLCGAQVSMVARVGNDTFGKDMLANFADKGIDATHVRMIDGVPTGVAPITVNTRTGENEITIVTGANDLLTPEEAEKAKPQLEQADCIILQGEIPLETNYDIIDFARKKGIRTIFNVAPAQPVDLSKLDGLDYLILNETEAKAVSGKPAETEAEARECAAHLLANSGVKKVLITLGAKGALLVGREGATFVPSFDMKGRTVDTAGAGDAFIGSFASFLGQGIEEQEALQRASLYAGMSTTKPGTQKSYPTATLFENEWNARQGAARSAV